MIRTSISIEGAAQFLLTRYRDLLDLRNPTAIEGGEVRRLNPALQIIEPASFLQIMESAASV